ncbi:dual specificity protein phosphatase 10 [Lepisosteus oculatus]|uniref:dual specificity protein phosphatase 10 n=1 Tax=Lepisosteus oculatus TaxID=7918 RepID=UPI0035F50084
MPPLPLDERIVILQRPKTLALRLGSPRDGPAPRSSSSTSSSERKRRSPEPRRTPPQPPQPGAGAGAEGHRGHTHTIDIKLSLGGAARGGPGGPGGRRGGLREPLVSLRLDLGQQPEKRREAGPPITQNPHHPHRRLSGALLGGSLGLGSGGGHHKPQTEGGGGGGGRGGREPLASYPPPASYPSRILQEVPCASRENIQPGLPRQPPSRAGAASSPTSSSCRYSSPEHSCALDLLRPRGCWRSPPLPCRGGGGGLAGLRSLGGCLSASSATNTSSSASTASECRAGLLRPLGSPGGLRRRLVGGCLPCAPLSSSTLRALQSCVGSCPPSAKSGGSTCSFCSSDPIVTFDPRGPRGPGPGAYTAGDDDDYSVRTIWPEELAKKMTRSKAQHHIPLQTLPGGQQNSAAGPVVLDCRNLAGFSRGPPHFTDAAGRRRLQQGKLAVLDFISASSARDSLQRLWPREATGANANGLADEPCAPPLPRRPPASPASSSPASSPPGSAHATLTRPSAAPRDREGQPLHLVLNSLNKEQDESNGRAPPAELLPPATLSLSASWEASGQLVMTPDIENAPLSPILPFLFLGNESDAQDLELLLRLNIGFVVNVTTHLPLYHLSTCLVRYKRLPATDNSRQNLRQYFEEVFEFIEEAHQCRKGVLIHCQAGVSRSATIVIAYLMKHSLMTMTDAYKYVKGRRPVISPNLNFMGQLLEFENDLNSGVTPRILTPKLTGVETEV